MTPTIRSATFADVGELARLRWQLYSEREPHDEPFETYVERFATFARDALASDDWRAWCAEADGRLVAAAWLQTVPRVPAPGHGDPRPLGYLTNMYVEPDHRSMGLGTRLLQELIGHCEASGFELVMTFPRPTPTTSTNGTDSADRRIRSCIVCSAEHRPSLMG